MVAGRECCTSCLTQLVLTGVAESGLCEYRQLRALSRQRLSRASRILNRLIVSELSVGKSWRWEEIVIFKHLSDGVSGVYDTRDERYHNSFEAMCRTVQVS